LDGTTPDPVQWRILPYLQDIGLRIRLRWKFSTDHRDSARTIG